MSMPSASICCRTASRSGRRASASSSRRRRCSRSLALGVVGLVHYRARVADRRARTAATRCSKTEIASSTSRSRRSTSCASRSRRCWRASRSSRRCRRTATSRCTCSTSSCASCPTASTCARSARSAPKITLVGYAQSNARVSTLMRNIESSPWLSVAGARRDQAGPAARARRAARPARADRVNEFTLNLQVKRAAPPIPSRSSATRRCREAGAGRRRPRRKPAPTKSAASAKDANA